MTRICKFCGSEFTPVNNRQLYCNQPHIRICPVCGKQYVEKHNQNLSKPPVACSYPCRVKSTQQTSLIKYGCVTPGNNAEARQKSANTVKHKELTKFMYIKDYRPVSKINLKINKMINDLGFSTELEYPIGNRVYDIIIPKLNTLIEIDPTFTHSNMGSDKFPPLDKYYHRDKTELAIHNGFKCIHLFDWDNAEMILKSICVSPDNIIKAADCDVYKLNLDVADKFIVDNHYAGRHRGQLFALGLIKDNEIYQVMTFGKPTYDKSHYVQIYRMCNKLGYAVDTGYDRLSQAASNFGLYDIVAYCDRAKSDGSDLDIIGMKRIRTTPPQLIWSKGAEYKYDSLFYSGKIDYSQRQKLIQDGWMSVYDCGQFVYEV